MTALLLENVYKARGRGVRKVRAIDGVSLSVEPGEVVLLEGPSGSGKTTLLTVAAGLLTADSGEITVGGERLDGRSASDRAKIRARHVGFVFQRANLLEGLTVTENAALAARVAGMPPAEISARIEALLEELGIAELADRYPSTLSGGEEHRAALVRGIVHSPSVVLADEPTGNLDSASGHAVALALRDLANRHEVAVVVATHDARLRGISDRRVHLVDGSVTEVMEPA